MRTTLLGDRLRLRMATLTVIARSLRVHLARAGITPRRLLWAWCVLVCWSVLAVAALYGAVLWMVRHG